MKIREKNLRDEIMWCMFEWYMDEDFEGCPFIYDKGADSYVPKGVPKDDGPDDGFNPRCKILCHKWFNREGCPCHHFGEKEVNKSLEKYLKQEGWIERGGD